MSIDRRISNESFNFDAESVTCQVIKSWYGFLCFVRANCLCLKLTVQKNIAKNPLCECKSCIDTGPIIHGKTGIVAT